MKKQLFWGIAVVVLGLIAFGVAQSRSTERNDAGNQMVSTAGSKKKPVPVVRVEIVVPQLLEKTAALTGTVTPTHTARLASPGEGPVEACSRNDCIAREGDRVKKGQRLMQIRHKTAEAQLAAAAQMLREQEAELQRISQLVDSGAIPGAQLDSARSKYENARAQLAKAEELAGDYEIKAPWKGVVSKVFVAEGDYVAPRVPLIEIFDLKSLVVQFTVPELQSTVMKMGMSATVQLDAYPGKSFHARINRVYPQLDERTHTLTVEAALTEHVDLIPGMFARIQLSLMQIPDALTVPSYCLMSTSGGGYAAFVVEEGKAVRRQLKIGEEVNGRIQILSGLLEGDHVIVAGQEKLKDGTSVKVIEAQQSSSEATTQQQTRP